MGSEFRISQVKGAGNSDVAIDDSGELAFVWAQSSYHIRKRYYDADGTPKADSARVNTTNIVANTHPSVAMGGGGSLVTWNGDPDDWRTNSDIYAQRYDGDGNPVGDEFIVNSTRSGSQSLSAAAMNNDGESLIVWSDGDIFAQIYDSNGAAVGWEFQVNTYTASIQWFSEIAMNDDGQFVAVWESNGQDGSGYGIFAEVGTIPEFATRIGDANHDWIVSADDFASVQANFGNTGDSWIPGDANGTGTVSADDYISVQGNFGNISDYPIFGTTAGLGGGIPIPEPGTLCLLAISGLAVLRRGRF